MTDQNNQITEITARPPLDFFDARQEAFTNADWQCVVKKDGCLLKPDYAHQKRLIIGDGLSGYERKISGVLQTADNLVVCCQSCHRWIHQNPVEATTLGYLDRD